MKLRLEELDFDEDVFNVENNKDDDLKEEVEKMFDVIVVENYINLSKDEELILGWALVKYRSIREEYVKLCQLISKDDLTEEDIIWIENHTNIAIDANYAQDCFLKQYKNLIEKIAYKNKRQSKTSASVEDLIQEGTLGLMNAMRTYNPTRNAKMSTHAFSHIHKTISLLINQEKSILTMSEGDAWRMSFVFNRGLEYDEKYRGEKATISKVQYILDKFAEKDVKVKEEQVLKIMDALKGTISFQQKVGEEGSEYTEILSNDFETEKINISLELGSIIEEQISRLKPHQKELILHKFPGIMEPSTSYKTLLESQGWSDDDVKKEWQKIKRTLKSYKPLNEIAEKTKYSDRQKEKIKNVN